MPEDERAKRKIPEGQIPKHRLEENDERGNGSGGKKSKSRFRKILLIYVCAGVLYSCICGMCMASVWRTDDHHTGACFSRIIGLEVIPNYEKSEFTLTADTDLFPDLHNFVCAKRNMLTCGTTGKSQKKTDPPAFPDGVSGHCRFSTAKPGRQY